MYGSTNPKITLFYNQGKKIYRNDPNLSDEVIESKVPEIKDQQKGFVMLQKCTIFNSYLKTRIFHYKTAYFQEIYISKKVIFL